MEKVSENNERAMQLEDCCNELHSQISDEKQNSLKAQQELEETFMNKMVILESEIDHMKNIISDDENNLSKLSDRINELQQQNNEKDSCINELQSNLQDTENKNKSIQELHNKTISGLRDEIEKLNKEKTNFSVTLETTTQTVEVLGSRLRNSDEHVERLKVQLEDAVSLNTSYKSQLSNLRKEYDDFKTEYNNVLITIVESKSALDKNHQKILQDNKDLVESLHTLETEVWSAISVLKNDLLNDIETIKKMSLETVGCYELKLIEKNNDYTNIKKQCDTAFEKINECQQLLSLAEAQIETKDQEFNEVSTENLRLTGTLVALEQEKNELKVLSAEFLKLLDEKNRKIRDCMKNIDDHEEALIEKHDCITKLTQLLEATEYIVLEKDKEISLQKSEISKHSTLINTLKINNSEELSKYEKKIEDLNFESEKQIQKYEMLEKEISQLNIEDVKELKDSIKEKDQEICKLVKKVFFIFIDVDLKNLLVLI